MKKENAQIPMRGTYDYVLFITEEGRAEREVAEAVEEAHAGGDRRATYALAMAYLHGHANYKKSVRRAVPLLKLAAKAEVAAAHFDLAVCYETGQGTKKNEKAAYRHYLAAALNGDNDALIEVGRCLFYGIGVERDRRTAEIWYRRAEALGINAR